jgi:hypothetical protein
MFRREIVRFAVSRKALSDWSIRAESGCRSSAAFGAKRRAQISEQERSGALLRQRLVRRFDRPCHPGMRPLDRLICGNGNAVRKRSTGDRMTDIG